MPPFLPWSGDLVRAAAGKPLAVLAGPTWDRWTKAFIETLDDPGVATALGDFASVFVDADLRPDVYRRVAPGGLPTLALLTPDGFPMVATAWSPPRTIREFLTATAFQWKIRAPQIVDAAKKSQATALEMGKLKPRPGPVNEGFVTACVEELVETCDEIHGGWGGAPKSLNVASLSLLARSNKSEGAVEALTRTVARISRTAMRRNDGQVFHSSETADWETPDGVILLVEQAEFHNAWIDAIAGTPENQADRASSLIDASAENDMPTLHAGFDITEAKALDACRRPVPHSKLADLRQRVSHDTGLIRRSSNNTDQIFHFADQAAYLRLLQRVEAPDTQDFARLMSGNFWDDTASAFRDRFGPPLELAPLDSPQYPVEENAIAAGVMARMGGEWLEMAKRCLATFTDAYFGQGTGAARLALAVMEVVEAEGGVRG